VTKSDAAAYCSGVVDGGQLWAPKSMAENMFVLNYVSPANPNSAWIGMTLSGMTYKDDVSGIAVNFTNWEADQPNLASACVEVVRNPSSSNVGKWKTVSCTSSSYGHTCQVRVADLPSPPTTCLDSSWKQHGNKCYKLTNDVANWDAALLDCSSLHPFAYLASIQSPEENDFILNSVASSNLHTTWIGRRIANESYRGVNNELFAYYNWSTIGQPNKTNDCVLMVRSGSTNKGSWRTAPCSMNNTYVCQLDLQVPTTTAPTTITATPTPTPVTTTLAPTTTLSPTPPPGCSNTNCSNSGYYRWWLFPIYDVSPIPDEPCACIHKDPELYKCQTNPVKKQALMQPILNSITATATNLGCVCLGSRVPTGPGTPAPGQDWVYYNQTYLMQNVKSAGFSCLRMYADDLDNATLANAKSVGLKVLTVVGLIANPSHLTSITSSNNIAIANATSLVNSYSDTVFAISCGNEYLGYNTDMNNDAIFNNLEAEIQNCLVRLRAGVVSHIAVGTIDVPTAWNKLESSGLPMRLATANLTDFIGVDSYAFYMNNGGNQITDACEHTPNKAHYYVLAAYNQLVALYASTNGTVLIAESGKRITQLV
jgi:hypothetical protein